ncbi:sel1 repeat family protein [Pseudomonas sp. UL073]|uniref:Sel1 repeat family protein n=1 Tax=Zestomonas insulae TaxID=2809017 RepID=A0ABS2IE27_9GAMM|nr:SEL1-like repeat protein [Pseudomonas insulae]MBM7060928.1 sel1 repeat family protein [Pseudomonas insulae]
MFKPVLSCLFAAVLCTGCASNFKPLRGEPAVVAPNRPAPPEAPVYGVASYEPPQVWLAPLASPSEVQGQARNVQRLPKPGQDLLDKARVAAEAGDQAGMLRLLQQAAESGNGEAHYQLARIYQVGEGVPVDLDAALSHLSLADAMGHAEATRVLAWNYLLGKGVQSDTVYGNRLMEKAARSNDRALRELSLLYLNVYPPGLDNRERGLELLDVASRAGDVQAERIYLQAQRQPQPTAEAVVVEQPFASETVPGLPSVADSEAQAEAVKRAALAGDLASMSEYADNLLQGRFPSIQPELESYAWYAVAARRGSEAAAVKLATLDDVRQADPAAVDAMVANLDSAIAPAADAAPSDADGIAR